jgi:2-keto-4-pentenoate hydratase/2-oxohepta-3-ene-1,7-dioic acid hydratase in catechol pathway
MFRDERGAQLGALHNDTVVDLAALSKADSGRPLPSSLLELIDLGEEGLERARSILSSAGNASGRPLSEVRLLPPLDPPRENVLAIGRNYTEHAAEMARARAGEVSEPTVFTKAQTTVIGPYDDVVIDAAVTQEVDWEAELGVVVGRKGCNIAEVEALDYVFGYTVVNDVSARDIQYGWGGQFFKGKSLDTFCPTGPWIVTRDEIVDPQNLRVMCRVNGVTKQDACTSDMIFSVAQLIARLSRGMTLLPGNLIATGTPPGVGNARQPPEYLHPGDVMETEVEGIGALRNHIVTRLPGDRAR